MLMKFATRQFSTSNLQCWRIAVIGSGLMGSGIAQVSAQSEHFVAIVDQSKPILDKAQKAIEANIVRVARKKFESDNEKQATFVKNVLKNITLTTDVNNAVSEADLVIEAVAEKLQLKQELLAQIEQAVPRKTIIATNTSSLRLQDISKNLKRKENFGGLHFFNPVPVMKLLEVVRGESTSDDTFNYLLKYGESIGKVTVKCKDTPGFIVNRLLVPYMLEAMRLYERGDASKEDIDQAMKLGAGYPMGPFQLLDYVGLDTTKFIQDGWHNSYPSEENFSKTIIATNTSSLRLQDISKNLKRKENFGGLHFFNPVPVMKLLEVVRGESTSDDTFNYLLKYGESIGKVTVKCKDTPGFIVNRLLVPYMLEAMRLYERGDASKEDIDQAMKLGAGYPMGPFQLLDYVGLDTTKFIQDGWHNSYPSEENFRPVEVLDKLVKEGKFGMKTGEGFYKYESKK